MGQFHFHPDEYIALMESELPDYYRLQDAAAAATGSGAARLLELGTGTGESALRVLARHPGASLVGIDESADMLRVAGERLPGADLRVAACRTRCPTRPFDLVFSVLAIHHLDGPGKADLFTRVAAVLSPGWRFVDRRRRRPRRPGRRHDASEPRLRPPVPAEDQLLWLSDAGFEA